MCVLILYNTQRMYFTTYRLEAMYFTTRLVKSPFYTFVLCAVLTIVLFSFSYPGGTVEVLAQELPIEREDNRVRIDFEDVDVQSMVRFISKITGKNFIVDDTVKGKISIVTPDKVTIEQAYQIFLSVLNLKGYTAVQSGPAIKIIPTKDARNVPLPIISSARRSQSGDLYVTHIVNIKHVDAQDLSGLLQNMMSADGLIAAYPTTNSIILIDTASNIVRIKELIKDFDVEDVFSKIVIIPLKYASCTDMADKLMAIFGDQYSAAARRVISRRRVPGSISQVFRGSLKIIPDERTNALIAMAKPTKIRQIREVIKKLDVEAPLAYGDIYVYYLENADAEEVAKVLQELSRTELSEPRTTAAGQAMTRAAQLGEITGQFQGPVKIASDKGTNSIIVFASQQDYRMIKNVLKKLDIRRNQVFVQALIAALSLNTSSDLGVWIKGGGKVGNNVIGGQSLPSQQVGSTGGRTQLPSQEQFSPTMAGGLGQGEPITQFSQEALSAYFLNPFSLPGFVTSAISGNTVNIAGQEIPIWQAVIQAVAMDSRSDILSTPYLLATDNQEAEINIGQEVPMLTSQITSIEAMGSYGQNVERVPVGIILKFTPKISEGDFVQLDIYQEVSQVDISAEYSQFGYTTNKRTAKTTAVVKDGNTVIIGGLIDTNVSRAVSKVPILGDIPVLGWLFKNQRGKVVKQNLVILLTPHIIRSPDKLEEIKLEHELMFEEFKRRNKIYLRPERLEEGNY